MGLSRRDFLKVSASRRPGAGVEPQPGAGGGPGARSSPPRGHGYSLRCHGLHRLQGLHDRLQRIQPSASGPVRPRTASGTIPWICPPRPTISSSSTRNGTGQVKDQEVNGYSFIRRFCMHCVDPSCISACPVSALTKDPKTGVVRYNKDNCIGCRYCQIACPYNVPKFQWDQAFPQIVKVPALRPPHRPGRLCGLLRVLPHRRLHLRQRPGPPEGGQTAAVFDQWARWPITLYAGWIPRIRRQRKVTPYLNHIYGDQEGGGTQVLMLANVPFNKLGLPQLPAESTPATPKPSTIPCIKGMIVPYVILGGLFYLIYKNTTEPGFTLSSEATMDGTSNAT